jgi:predicted nicotinamide N-methyase
MRKVKGKTVLELGSGPAFVGISAAILDAKEVILSDLAYTLPLIRRNIQANQKSINSGSCKSIKCMEIDWFQPPDRESLSASNNFPQVMLIADCVWLKELVNPLVNTVELLSSTHTEVIITYQRRGKAAHDLFWNRLQSAFTSIEDVDTMALCGLQKPESISLLLCHR